MRSILFDVDGVLVHGFHARPEKRVRWDRTLKHDLGIEAADFTSGFIERAFINEVLPGKRSLIDALDEWFAEAGHRISPMQFISYWLNRDSNLNDELLALIGQLRAAGNCRLYVATNQEHLRAMHLWLALGFSQLFDDMFHAARLGALKPDPAFFAGIERLIGPQDEPPLLFDDNEGVTEAARAHGWEAVLYEELADCAHHPVVGAILGRQL